MIPILYDTNEEQFISNGLGRLNDCISCEVTEERNGIYECEFTYPVTGQHYADIQEGRIIAVIHSDQKDIQPFEIYARSAPLNGVVTFRAHHISYRLGNVILQPFTASSITEAIAKIPGMSINDNPFTFWTDKSTIASLTLTEPKAVKDLLGGSEGSLLDVYGGGEYEWDKLAVKLYQNRGTDSGVEIRYGKNLTDITQEIDISGTYSAVVPYWVSGDGDKVVTLSDWVVATEQASYTKLTTMDLSDRFEEEPSEAQLRATALSILENSEAWLPDENIEVDFIALWQTEEYKTVAPLQRLKLCDKVSVYYPELGVNATKMKIVSVTYDVLMERYSRLELGKARTSFAEVIKAATEAEILSGVPTKSMMQAAIETATQLLAGGLGGHLVIGTNAAGQPNELLLMDTDNKDTAVNVLRINMNGIGFSSTGYEGPFHSAWTLDGTFIADWITAGTLNANLIKAGVIQSPNGSDFWNLETGAMSIGGGRINVSPGDSLDTTIRETSGTTTRTIMDNANAYGLGWKVNASRFNNSNNGECYYHGFAANGAAADVAGWVVWKSNKVTIPIGCGVNPNATMPYDKLIYSVWRTSDNAYHDVCFNDSTGKWEGNTYSQGTNVRDWIPSARSAWTWNEDTDIVLASYMLPSGEGAIYGAQLFTPPKKYSELPEKAMEYSSSELSDFAETVTAEIDDIKDQLDGVIDTYYYSYAPTLNNIPASEWTTEALKADHEGDLFLDTSTGKSYRFVKDNGVWQWKEIPDTASAQALQLAQTAKDTADGKRRVFIVQPTPPYDTGDLWMQGTDGDILVCTTAKAEGAAFTEADWSKLNKYTDDASVTTIVEEHISEIQVGGRNLLTDTNAPSLNPRDGVAPRYWSNLATLLTNGTGTDIVELPDTPIPQVKYGAKFVCTQTGGQRHELAFYTGVSAGPIARETVSRLKNGETYTMSMWARSDVAGARIVMFMQAQSAGSAAEYVEDQFQTIDVANKWTRFKRTFTWKGTADEVRVAYFGSNYNLVGTVYACGFQLEQGNVATDWSDYPRTLVSYGGRNLIRNTNEPTLIGDNPWETAEGIAALPSINANYYEWPAHSIMVGYGVALMNWEVVDHGFRTTAIEDGYYPHIRFGSNTSDAITKEQGLHGLIPGQTYTFSADYRCKLYTKIKGDGGTGNLFLAANFNARLGDATSYTTVESKNIEYYLFYERGDEKSGRLIFTFTVPENAVSVNITIRPSNTTAANHQTGDYLELANMKLEKGNTASEWSPAPEDTDKALLDTRKTIQGRNYLLGTGTPIERYMKQTSGNAFRMLYSTNAMQTLADLDFKVGDKVTISFDWTLTGVEEDAYGSFRIEEYGKTSSSEFTNIGIATTITPSATYMSGHESVTLTLTTTTVNLKGFNLRMDNIIGSLKISNMKLERGELATPWIAANEDAYTQSNGTNMLRGTNVLARLAAGGWEKGLWRASGGSVGTRTIVDISDDSLPKMSKGVRFESTAYSITGAAGLGIGQNGVPNIKPGKAYTLSCYARGTGVIFMMPGLTAWEHQGIYIDSEEYVRVSMTFTIREVAAYADQTTHKANVFFGATGVGADVTLCGFKMEEGLTATEWCEAPEDIEDEIAGYVESIGEQLDGKAETWYQPTDPSTDWTAEEKAAHKGDLWYNTANGANTTWYWDGLTWRQQNAPKAVFDEIDGKATVFTGSNTPSDPQEKDLWFKGTDEGIYTYVGGSWVEYNKYTDDTLAKQNIKSADIYYYVSTSPTDLIGGSWSTNAPTWTQGTYIWTKTIWTKGDGTPTESAPTCLAGNDAASYHLDVSASAVIKKIDGTFSPSTITLTGRTQTGNSAMTNYSGRFKIETTADGTTWTSVYQSSSNQATYTYTVPTGVTMIRCSLYRAGGVSVLLDQQTIPILAEANNPDENFLIDAAAAETINIETSDTSYYSAYRAETEYGKSITNGNETDLFFLAFDWSTTATEGNAWAQIDGTALSNNLIVSASGYGDQLYRVSISSTVKSGHYEAVFRLSATQAGKTTQRVRIRVQGATAGTTFTVSNIQLRRCFDGAKGEAGADAYTVILTNENHTFAGDEEKAITSSTVCNVVAYKGTARIAATIGSITGVPAGMTATIASNGTTSARFTVAVTTAMVTRNGTLTVPVTVEDKTFNMIFTYSLAIKGDEGVGIAQVTELYYVSNSATAPAKPTISAYPSGVTTDDSTTSGRGKWNKACAPWSTTYKYFYTCSEVLYDDGTRNWTDVSSNKGLEDANSTAATAKETADAAAQIIGGYTIKWNVSSFAGNTNNGEGYICKLDPLTGTQSDAAGWAMWNGTKRTIPKNVINPDVMAPFNTPIYVVCRLTAADAAAGQNTLVWYDSGWKYMTKGTNAATADQAVGDWTWAAATDMVIGKFVEPASEAAFVETEIYNPPLMYNQTSVTGFTVSGAQAAASAAQSAADDAHKLAVLTRLIGTSPTGASEQVKVITCDESFDEYVTGMRMTVTFTNANSYTAEALQFNVNSKGVKSVAVAGETTGAANPFIWTAGAKITFEYDGQYWVPQNLQTFEAQSDSPATTKAKDTKLAPTEGATREETALGFALYKGARVVVKFTNMNAVAGPTLNVGGTGAKQIRANGANIAASSPYGWKDGARIEFIFDGTYWQVDTRTGDAVEIVDLEMTQEEVMKRLTNNYTAEAFVIENDQIYINMSYLRAGMVKIGGGAGYDGILEVYNSSGTRVGRWDKNALYLGNVAGEGTSGLDNPNTKIGTDGAITSKNAVFDDYIKIIGNSDDTEINIPIQVLGLDGTDFKYHMPGWLKFDFKGLHYMFPPEPQTFPSGGVPVSSAIERIAVKVPYSRPTDPGISPYGFYIYDKNSATVNALTNTSVSLIKGALIVNSTRTTASTIAVTGNATINGDCVVRGAKPRLYKTEDYGERYLYAYETPAPTFGDIGEGVIGEDGLCYVYLDPVFAETITTTQYQVFLQAYGEGQAHVKERKANYFVVSGTPGMNFGWELKARQKDLDSLRLDKSMGIKDIDTRNEVDYAGAAASHINALLKEREETS